MPGGHWKEGLWGCIAFPCLNSGCWKVVRPYAYVYVLCMYMSMILTVSTWRSEDMEVRVSLLPCGSRHKTRVVSLGKWCLYPLSGLTIPLCLLACTN